MRRSLAPLLFLPLLWGGCGKDTTQVETRRVPVIIAPRSGSTSGRLKITVQGTAEPDRAVDIFVDGGASPVRVYSSNAGVFEAGDLPLGGQGGRVIWARMVHDTSLVSSPVAVTMSYATLATPVLLFPVHGAVIPAGSIPVAGRVPTEVVEVEIYRNGTVTATVPVCNGAFLLPGMDPSGSGYVDLWARGMTAAGGHTAFSESVTVIVGGGASPTVQSVLSPAPDTVLAGLHVIVQGLVSGSDELGLLIDGGDTGLRALPASGEFSLGPAVLLDEGPHIVGIVSLRGQSRVAEDAVRLWVDRIAPPPPVILRPAAAEVHLDGTISVEGAAEANALVELAVDGSWLASVHADAAGAFSTVLVLPGDGSYALTARSTDKAGNVGGNSSPRTIVVDSAAPSAPALSTPIDGDLLVGDTFTVAGSAQSGSWLEVLIDGNVADGLISASSFEIALPTPTPDGGHRVSVRAASTPGAGWVRGDSVGFSVDLTPPLPPVILQPPESTTWGLSVVNVAGAAEPRASVSVFSGDETLGQTVASATGAWSVTIEAFEDDGPLTLYAVAVDTAGHTSAAGEPCVIILDREPPALVVTSPEAGELFSASPVTVCGVAESGAMVTIDGLEAAVVDGAFQALVSLAEGPDTVVVAATDAVGNGTTVRLPLSLDTTPPFILLSGPADSLLTQSSSVTVAGTTEVGSLVTIQGSPVSVDAGGGFSGVVSLPFGWTTIVVVATDRAGWTTELRRHVVRNDLPTAPTSLRPDGGIFVPTGRHTLAMAPATDVNGDALLHTMEVYSDPTLTLRVAQSPPLPASGGTVAWAIVPELSLTGGTRYWRARAFDGLLWGPWSAVATFRIPDIGARNPHRVLGYGDSITAGAQTQNGGWIWCEGYREELELALTAFFGDAIVDTTWVPGGTSASGVAEMQGRLGGRPEAYVLILFGTIDILDAAVNFQGVRNNVAAIASYARSLGMVAVVGTVPPLLDEATNARAQQLNTLLRQLADGNGVMVADHYTRLVEVAAGSLSRVVCPDGVHPSDLGYSVMAEVWYHALTGSDDYPLMGMVRRAAQAQASHLGEVQ
ncbi:hypothetical protein JXA88_11860 [Candidatus Fermentibacteria bacterium]|nr:hypothetical protein [Candidatus Fermentibacteria bacterium]